MPIHFRVDKADTCVYVRAEEPLTDADLTQYQLDLAAHPDHGAGFDQLVDLRSADGLKVTSAGVEVAGRLTGFFAEHLRGTRCALVVSSGVAFGMARMFEAHASESINIRVFGDLEAAKIWLGLSGKTAPGDSALLG